MLFARLL